MKDVHFTALDQAILLIDEAWFGSDEQEGVM